MRLDRLLEIVLKVATGLSTARGRRALALGVGPVLGHERALRLKDWKTIVDIGANRGQFSLAALAHAPRARIHAFEPLAEPCALFLRVFEGEARVSLHQVGVGPEERAAEMHVAGLDHSSSLLPIGDLQTLLYPETAERGVQEVQLAPLDKFLDSASISSPALLKLDVQGFEYEALCGCEKLLGIFDNVYVECSYVELYDGQKLVTEIIGFLADKGFVLKDVLGTTRDNTGAAVQSDFLFARNR